MIKFKIFGVDFKVSFLFLCLVVWFLIGDSGYIFSTCIFSSLFHEFFHIIFLSIFSANIKSISFKVFGISIKRSYELSFLKELFVLSSGCFGNLVLALIFLYFTFYDAVFVNLFLLIFNLLPFKHLDGGQILKMVLERFLELKTSLKILNIVSIFMAVIGLFILAILMISLKINDFIFILVLAVISIFFE